VYIIIIYCVNIIFNNNVLFLKGKNYALDFYHIINVDTGLDFYY